MTRRILGLAGAPGAGKTMYAARVVADSERSGVPAAQVPMDGFHLADEVLAALRLLDRKGAPDTFDANGFAALLRRLRAVEDAVVYAPEFRREIEEPVACALPVPREVPLVVTEGNYLLVGDEAWGPVRALLDEAWFVETNQERRVEWLIARHVAFGKAPEHAREWVLRSDERNAALVATTQGRADLVVRIG